MNNVDIIKLFLEHKIGNTMNVFSAGDRLYSYRTCIAEWLRSDSMILNITKYSCTTSRHQSQLKWRLPPVPFRVIEVKEVPRDASSLKKYLDKIDQLLLNNF